MKQRILIQVLLIFLIPRIGLADNSDLQRQIQLLQQQTIALQTQLNQLQKQLVNNKAQPSKKITVQNTVKRSPAPPVNSAPPISVNKPRSANLVIINQTPEPTTPVALQKERPLVVPKPLPNPEHVVPKKLCPTQRKKGMEHYHSSIVSVHSLEVDPESLEFYPTALVADDRVLTYIAGTPVVSSPYLGSRPAFDGSDYIVNISSINRDIRLMQQRRSLDRAYTKMGYPMPNRPILALSGKVEPIGYIGQPYFGQVRGDWNLGSDELDIAAILNDKVEAYMGLAYDAGPPAGGGQRISNSALGLNMGFVNIGDLDESPFYLTAGQLFAPFGRFSTSMVSPTLPMMLARTKARPIILGYKSQKDTGLFAAVYGFSGDTTLHSSAVGGLNLGYILDVCHILSEIGVSYITSLDDAGGMQFTGSEPGTTFGGFSSITNGSEFVHKIGGFGAHTAISFDRYNITAEWVTSMGSFHVEDLSFNGVGAHPQAAQVEAGITFMSFNRPSSLALAYQWSAEALALNLPQQRINAVYNISIWKDTVESIEYRHDIAYGHTQYANGAAPTGVTNLNTVGTGGAADTLFAQIGIYF